jgi:TonB-linked SusC/RagA family outer membrane protein
MMKKYFLLILFSFVYGASISQSKIVKGSVQDAESGEQLVGVAVKLFGVDRGVITDYDGNYQVTVPDDIDQLVFSYIGYETLTVSIGKRSIINVSLSIDVTELDEVVVVGYGQIRKSDITGAVASVKSEDLVKAPTSNAIDALQGKVAGLSVLSASGNPGAAPIVRLRGITTLNNNSPIFVVDGVITDDVSFLNPPDIESVEVLKDASSTAIFGSRGSNGVIIITTKTGATAKPQVNVSLEQGFESIDKPLEVMNRDEFTKYYNVIDPGRYQNIEQLPDIDWQSLVFRDNTPITNLNASVSGKSEKINYYLSGGYFAQEGVMPKSKFERITGKINTIYQIGKGFEIGTNLTVSHTRKENPPGIITMMYLAFPIDPPYREDGGFAEVRGSNNPLAALEYTNSTTKGLSALGNLYAQVTFLNDFRFKSSFQFDMGANKETSFTPQYFVSAIQQNELSSLSKNVSDRFQFIFENTVSYDKEFNEQSRLNVVAGMSTQVRRSEYLNTSTRDLLREEPEFWYLNAGNPELLEASNNASESSPCFILI